jgi:adenylate cyclase
MKSTLSRDIQTRGLVLISLVILLLIGLPLVVWLDLKNLTEANLRRQAGDLNSVVSSVRNYYATNVVGRILSSPGSAQVAQRVAHN